MKKILPLLAVVALVAFPGCRKVNLDKGFVQVERVDISQTEAAVVSGQTLQLSASVYPSKATHKDITWSSSNENVATVDQTGLVTAKVLGPTTITATARGGVSASCALTVVREAVPATDLRIVPEEVYLTVGGEAQLQLVFTPSNATNRSVKWYIAEGNDKDVIGITTTHVVTGKKKGHVTLMAVSEENDDVCASVEVYVVDPFTSVSITEPTSDLPKDTGIYVLDVGQTCQLTATGTPSDCGDRIEWVVTSGDTYASVTADGLLKGLRSGGTATVAARSASNPTVLKDIKVRVFDAVTDLVLVPVNNTALTRRPTEYIGTGCTQQWKIKILPETAYQKRQVHMSGFFAGNAGFQMSSFSVDENNVLTVTAPSNPNRISDKTSKCSGGCYLWARSYNEEASFAVSEFDPFQPKFGDLVYYDNVNNKVLTFDYGYRGKGIVETPLVSTLPDWSEKFGSVVKRYRIGIIGYIGNEHLTEDPFLVATNYSLPGINGKHGILIPYNKIYATRTSSPYGWQVPSDGLEQFCSESDNLPGRAGPSITGIDMGRLRENTAIMSQHYAFHNTAALLWYNMSRGDSHMVRPEIYFASSAMYNLLGKPSGDYATRYNKMHEYDLGTNRSCTPWLFPGFADMSCIFSGQPVVASYKQSTVSERANIIIGAIKRYSGNVVDFDTARIYWVNHDSSNAMASVYTVMTDFTILRGSTYKNYVELVLPICYF